MNPQKKNKKEKIVQKRKAKNEKRKKERGEGNQTKEEPPKETARVNL